MKQESEPKIESGKNVESVEEEIVIEKSKICDKQISDKEIAKFLAIIKDIRKKHIPEQDKKRWIKKFAPRFLCARLDEMLKKEGENVVETELEEEGEIEFEEREFKWITEGKNQGEQSLRIWSIIEEQGKEHKKFQPIDVDFDSDEIDKIMDKLLVAVENIDKERLEQITKEKQEKRENPRHHKIKVVK